MRLLFTAAFAFMLLGSDCDPGGTPLPPPEPNAYCGGAVVEAEPTVYESAVDYVTSALATIIGGEISVDRRATVQVRMGSGYCSGTVIGKRTVLTAAHCEDTTMNVVIDGQTIRAARTVVHPNYSGNWPYNDLLILQFSQDLPGPVVDVIYEAGTEGCTELIAQGFGKSEFNEPATLREASYSVVKESAMTLQTTQIKWGGHCFGDSGGPLYAVVNGELQIAGVTSTTYSQDCLVGGDHVNLRFYKPWIEGNTI